MDAERELGDMARMGLLLNPMVEIRMPEDMARFEATYKRLAVAVTDGFGDEEWTPLDAMMIGINLAAFIAASFMPEDLTLATKAHLWHVASVNFARVCQSAVFELQREASRRADAT